MSARGAEGIIASRKAQGLTATGQPASQPKPQPVDKGTAGHTPSRKSQRRHNVVKGAAEGAVAGPEGAAAGAVAGAVKKTKPPTPKRSGGGGRSRLTSNRALVAEFVICMLILGLSPVVAGSGGVTVGKFMKKASATAGVFVVLGLISSAGDTGKKFANGLGALVTLTVVLNERSIFGVIVKAVSGQDVPVNIPSGPTYTPAQLRASVGGFTPPEYVQNIITGDPNINPDMTPGSILAPLGMGALPTYLPGPDVGIPGLPPGIGGNG